MKTQVELTEKEIIEKLLAHYEYAHKEISKAADYESVSYDLKVNSGLCWCADEFFGIDISRMPFILLPKKNFAGFIFKRPIQSNSKSEHLKCIQYRIDFLKNALKELQ